MNIPRLLPTHLALVKRSACLALAILGKRDDGRIVVLEVQVTRAIQSDELTESHIRTFAAEYGVEQVISEVGSPLAELARAAGFRVVTTTLVDAKCVLTGTRTATQQALFQTLVAREPQFKRLVTMLTATGRIKLSERWKTVQLLSVALGLAATHAAPAPANKL